MLSPAQIVVTLLVASVIPAGAKAQHMNDATAPCRGNFDTPGLYNCFAKAFAREDAALNRIYGRIRGILEPDDQTRLLQAQRLWLQYRDATCSAERALYGVGTGGPPTQMACREALTRERISVLNTTYGWRVEKSSN